MTIRKDDSDGLVERARRDADSNALILHPNVSETLRLCAERIAALEQQLAEALSILTPQARHD